MNLVIAVLLSVLVYATINGRTTMVLSISGALLTLISMYEGPGSFKKLLKSDAWVALTTYSEVSLWRGVVFWAGIVLQVASVVMVAI